VLRASGPYFVDGQGRVVILRGVSLSGGAKVPPFLPLTSVSVLDQLPARGINVIRLVFIWEAFEPSPGQYDEAYLERMRWITAAAWERGLQVIIDIHQDGFSRFVSRGSGDGFPRWVLSPRSSATTPDNGPNSKYWPIRMLTDHHTYRCFSDFYADVAGVRTRYLLMLQRVASAFAFNPGVIGYEPLNEPWGSERRDLVPLYRDACAAIRSVDPDAILFLQGHFFTNCGLQSRLPCPCFDNVAYAPHYYQPATILREKWSGRTSTIRRAFAHMQTKCAEWNAPLLVGEFGVPANSKCAPEYVDYLHDHLDEALASGVQWNYTPTWNPRDKDGWNDEDFNIFSPEGTPRRNYVERPYPQATAGIPLRFHFQRACAPNGHHVFEFHWNNCPGRGPTEIYVPNTLFPKGSVLTIEGPGAYCTRLEARQLVLCHAPNPGIVRVTMISP